jgi:hypothetical protein
MVVRRSDCQFLRRGEALELRTIIIRNGTGTGDITDVDIFPYNFSPTFLYCSSSSADIAARAAVIIGLLKRLFSCVLISNFVELMFNVATLFLYMSVYI